FEGVEKVKALLADPQTTSARLVVNPEKMVIDEARRTFTYLALFGYGVDSVVINRVLPDAVSDPYFDRWRSIQKGHLDTIDSGFADVPRLRLRLFDDEMVGVEKLRLMADELYGSKDPITGFTAKSPFKVTEKAGEIVMEMKVPFVERGDVDVFRHGSELFLQVGPYRRSFVLPDTLRRRQVTRAKLEKGVLRVSFGAAPARKRAKK
ncbi:MAG: ArsA family ATPase, partial [Actinomycetota bacterium]|nr:ArsA family ATPase [Actinomycetota bacterium]